jgi:two-component system response regulator YesN
LTLITEAKKYGSFFSLIISGYEDFEYVRTALREGTVDYLLKPIDREQFRSRMQDIKEKIILKKNRILEWDRMHEQAAKVSYLKQIQLLNLLTSRERQDQWLVHWDETFPSGIFCFLYVSLDGFSNKTNHFVTEDWRIWAFAIENIIDEIVCSYDDDEGCNWWWGGTREDYYILLQTANRERSDSLYKIGEEMVEQIRKAIQRYTPLTASATVSHIFEELHLLPSIKDQAYAILQYRLIHGGNQTFDMSMITNESSGYPAVFHSLSQRVMDAMERTSTADTIMQLQVFFDEIQKLGSPQTILKWIKHLIVNMYSVWIDVDDGENTTLNSLETILRMTESFKNIVQLKSFIHELALKIIEHIRKTREKIDRQPIDKAKAWIQEHLEKNITITMIAEHVYMNPTYFCQYFKSQTGETVLDFITRMRINKAKELLKNPHLKLQDISVQVGYQDPKYFSRLFKQHIGLLPSKYREEYMQ